VQRRAQAGVAQGRQSPGRTGGNLPQIGQMGVVC